MTTYEYKIEPFNINAMSIDLIVKRMNELGADGWQASGLFPSPAHMLFVRIQGTSHPVVGFSVGYVK